MKVKIAPNAKSVNINCAKQAKVKTEASFTKQLMANDYEYLKNKPKIENIELNGNKTFNDLGIHSLTNMEIEKLLNL